MPAPRPDLAALLARTDPADPSGSSSDGTFTATSVPDFPGYWIGRDAGGLPALLIEADKEEVKQQPGIETRSLSILFRADCELRVHGEFRRDRFTVIRCRSADSGVRDHFVELLASLMQWLGGSRDSKSLRALVESLIELFRAAEQPGRKTIQGLWGELLLIAGAEDPLVLVRAWHNTPGDRYDFALAEQRVEVKTGVRNTRIHRFRLEQLRAPLFRVAIASIAVETSGGGTSIKDLAADVHARLGADAAAHMKLDRLIYATLGRDWTAADLEQFDLATAQSSLRCFDAATIPAVALPLPDGVSEVGFMADAAMGQVLTPEAMSIAGGLWRAARKVRTLPHA